MKMLKTVLVTVCLMLIATWVSVDFFAARHALAVLEKQAPVALNKTIQVDTAIFNTRAEVLELREVQLLENESAVLATASRVRMDVSIYDLLSRQFTIHELDVYDAVIHVRYFDDGSSNIKQTQAYFRDYLSQRRLEGKARIKWDLYAMDFYRPRLKVQDAAGQLVADVIVPKLSIPALSSNNAGAENAAKVLSAVYTGLIKEVFKGNAQGQYDLPGLQQLALHQSQGRWSQWLSSDKWQQYKKEGQNLLDQILSNGH